MESTRRLRWWWCPFLRQKALGNASSSGGSRDGESKESTCQSSVVIGGFISGGRFRVAFPFTSAEGLWRTLGAAEVASVGLSPFPLATIKAVLADFSPFLLPLERYSLSVCAGTGENSAE